MKEKRRDKGVQNQADRKSNSQSKGTKAGKIKATAPYNFIPLSETIVEAQERPDFDCYHMENNDIKRFNGYIECQLENLTHLYIRDTYTDEELLKKETTKEDNKDNHEFFSPGGIVRIPGSSLRGMIRNLVEIMSWGKFGFCDKDRKLFFRAVGDNTSLGTYYREMMIDEQDAYFPRFNAGLLRKMDDGKFRIYPSQFIKGTQIYRVNFDKKTRKVAGTNIRLNEFNFKNIFFKPVVPEKHTHYRKQNRKTKKIIDYSIKYALVTEISRQNMEGYVAGILVSSGNLGNKKHFHWIINMPSSDNYIELKKHDVNMYKKDENRDERIKLLEKLETNSNGVPCFFIETEMEEIFFGHTGMFRIPYNYTIGDHIPEELKENEKTDMAEAIFGKLSEKDSFASRVFFEDAFLEPGQRNFLSKHPLTPQILSTPKPTTFQHYLEQEPNGSLNHWNTRDKNIRGNKLYWHRNVEKWEKNSSNNKKLLTQIKPLKPYTKFRFKIRFENLSEVELGAILYALDLPNNCRHKLGMGKPLGLGSVKIAPKLFLTNRESRYTMLFEDDSWFLATEEVELESFKRAFEKYILFNIKEELLSLWDVERMKHLKTMLDFSNIKDKTWNEKTKYMTVNEFKKRPVLPKSLDIKEL